MTKGPLVYALQKYDFFVLFPINPATLAKYREAFKPSRAKDDPTDAEHALELLMHHRDRLTALNPQSVPMRTLLHLVEQRRRVVNDKTRFTNRLGYALKQYFPQALDWFEHTDTIVFCDFLTRWPTLLQVKRARATSGTRTIDRHLKKENLQFRDLSQKVRFERACELLLEPSASIFGVALSLGFSEPANFSRAFRRVMGMTPGEYQQRQGRGAVDDDAAGPIA